LAVPGNRETQYPWLDREFWRREYRKADFQLLVNETTADSGVDAPVFAGVDDYRHGNPDLSSVASPTAAGKFVVLLSHSPDTVGHTTGKFIGHLILAGHTHGGQVRLPGIGPVYTSSVHGRQFDRGWFRRRSDGARLYITTGTGNAGMRLLRFRILCPTEVVLLEFVPE